jgi:uncharacterized protein
MSLDPTAPAASYSGPAATDADKNEATITYIAGFFTPLVPLILLLVKKDASPFVKDQIKETLNWGITLIIAFFPIMIVATILSFIHPLLGLLVLPVYLIIVVAHIFFTLVKGMSTMKQGVAYRYPFALRLVK